VLPIESKPLLERGSPSQPPPATSHNQNNTTMKNLTRKDYFYIVGLLLIGSFVIYEYFDNRNKIKNLDYGIKANGLRNALGIPIIEDNMRAESGHDAFFGNRWKAWREEPIEDEVLHVWKNVTPSENENYALSEEWDAFRKKESDGRIRQFNILCKVINDSAVIRTGSIFYNSKPSEMHELNESGIDSILKLWNIK
jgi:hypothetical protein